MMWEENYSEEKRTAHFPRFEYFTLFKSDSVSSHDILSHNDKHCLREILTRFCLNTIFHEPSVSAVTRVQLSPDKLVSVSQHLAPPQTAEMKEIHWAIKFQSSQRFIACLSLTSLFLIKITLFITGAGSCEVRTVRWSEDNWETGRAEPSGHRVTPERGESGDNTCDVRVTTRIWATSESTEIYCF